LLSRTTQGVLTDVIWRVKGDDVMSPHSEPEGDRMTTSLAELKEPLAVIANTVREIRYDVEQLKRDTEWLVRAVQAMLEEKGIT
jgi:hypothetical protein